MRVSEFSDSEEVYQLEKRLQESSDALAALVADMGKAKQVIEFNGDMRKRALATAMTVWLESGESAAAADAKARGSYIYGQEMKTLADQLREAETTKAKWEATKIQFEAARSLLSAQKEMSRL